ncbi:MAG: hypothetical protein AB7O73_08630 [Bacteroidia bacterium]
MKQWLRNWLFLSNINSNISSLGSRIIIPVAFSFFVGYGQNPQIANYVNNGSFEIPQISTSQKAKFWDAIDSTKYCGLLFSSTISPYSVPLSSFTYQWPKKGCNYFGSTLVLKPNTQQTQRGYPRNRLKGCLEAGKIYCVKFYCNVTNQSSFAVDALGAYFADSALIRPGFLHRHRPPCLYWPRSIYITRR